MLADEIGGLAILASLVDESPGLPPAGPRAVPFPGPGAGALAVDAWAGRARRLAHLPATMRTIGQGLTDPALLEVLRDRGLGLGREPVAVHASRLAPARIRPARRIRPAPGPHQRRIGADDPVKPVFGVGTSACPRPRPPRSGC